MILFILFFKGMVSFKSFDLTNKKHEKIKKTRLCVQHIRPLKTDKFLEIIYPEIFSDKKNNKNSCWSEESSEKSNDSKENFYC